MLGQPVFERNNRGCLKSMIGGYAPGRFIHPNLLKFRKPDQSAWIKSYPDREGGDRFTPFAMTDMAQQNHILILCKTCSCLAHTLEFTALTPT